MERVECVDCGASTFRGHVDTEGRCIFCQEQERPIRRRRKK